MGDRTLIRDGARALLRRGGCPLPRLRSHSLFRPRDNDLLRWCCYAGMRLHDHALLGSSHALLRAGDEYLLWWRN